MSLTGKVFENNKIRTAVTYISPLDGEPVCRDVYISYKITIGDKVGCYTYCYKNEVVFDVANIGEGFTVTGILQLWGKNYKNIEFNGTGVWNSVMQTPFGPLEIVFGVGQKIWGKVINNWKLTLQTAEDGWQTKPVAQFPTVENSNYALGTNAFCAVAKK
jgi:hypothetical protein